MTNPPSSQIVRPTTQVVFADTERQADSLDTVVATQGNSGASVIGEYQPWQTENMKYLAEKVAPTFTRTKVRVDSNNTEEAPLSEFAQALLPYVVMLGLNPNDLGACASISIKTAVAPALIRSILEQKSMYGEALKQTGIYEAIGLDKDEPMEVIPLLDYIPESASIKAIHDRFLPRHLHGSPSLQLLTFPVAVRPFFAGVLKDNNIGSSQSFYLKDAMTLKQVMAYAQKIEHLPRVREYMDILNGKGGTK